MKQVSLIAALATATLLCACAALPTPDAPQRVSADYDAVGETLGLRAFVYGKRTVLEFPRRPLWLSIQDENGVAVPYEREGCYYRLPRKLVRFTVQANARTLAFSLTNQNVSSNITAVPTPAHPVAPGSATNDTLSMPTVPVTVRAGSEEDDDVIAIKRLAALQRDEVRRVIAAGALQAAEAKVLWRRLDHSDAQPLANRSTTIRVQFDTASTDFESNDQLVRILVPAAKAAERINLRGRTDARIAGSVDASIALGRALAARRFLVEQGVDDSKINVSSLKAGDFIAPPRTEAGRALNRRVEIELVDGRYAMLRPGTVPLQRTKP